jgi:hypothetical protein
MLISEELLHRIHDDELSMRLKASELFKNLDPYFIIPKLLALESHRVDKVRSAAHASLLELFNSQLESEIPFIVLINALRLDQPLSPEDIGTFNLNGEKKLEKSQQILSFIPIWGEKVTKTVQQKILTFLIGKIFLNPSDALLIHAMTRLSAIKGIHQHAEMIFGLVLNQTKKTNQNDAFDFLSPLLILKTLPLECFPLESENQIQLFHYCFHMQQNQINEIKKLAAEITSRFPIQMGFQKSFESFKKDLISESYENSKVYLFSLCNMVMLSNDQHLDFFQETIDFIFEKVFVIPCVSQSIQKVQLGCIDFIAAVVMKDLEGELLGKVIQIIEKYENETLSVLMCHVMTSTSRLLSAKQMIKFSEISMKSLIKCSMKASSMVRCASLQSLLHFSYQLKASVFPYTTRLFDVTISALKSTDSNVRLLGLKLFSALLVSREDIIQDHQHQFLEIQKLLGGLSLMDNDSEVRKLAENLVSTLFQSK